MPLAHRPLANVTFLVQIEMERLAEKLATLYEDDIEQVLAMLFFSLLTYRLSSSIMQKTPLIYDTFVEIAQRKNLILMVNNCSGKRSFSKLKYIDPIADFA